MSSKPSTCPACGAPLRADPADPARRVCSGCGARYAVGTKKQRAKPAPAASHAPANVFAELAAVPPPTADTRPARPGHRSGTAVAFILGGAAVLLLGVVAVVGLTVASRLRAGAPPTAVVALSPQLPPLTAPATGAQKPAKGPTTTAEPTSREKPAPPPSQKAPPPEPKPAPVPEDPAVPGLVAKLKDPDLLVRINAVNELAAKGQAARPALPALIDLFKNPPPIVPKAGTDVAKEITLRTDLNSALAQAIERIGLDPALLPSLLQGLKAGDRTTVTVSALLLAIMGDPAVDPLVELLKDKDPELRLRAIRALAFSRDLPDRAIKPAIERLEDDNEEVRTAAPAALARLGPRAAPAIPALIKAVKAKRPLAAATLGTIGPLAKDAVPTLREALADQETVVTSPVLADSGDNGSGPPSMSLAWAAAFALGRMGPDAAPAVPDLIKTLGHKRLDDRAQAAQALGRLGAQSPEAVAALARLLADDKELPFVQLAAVDALGKLGEPGSVPLVEALKSKKADVRRAAVTALAQSPSLPAAAVPALAGCLRDDDPSVRTAAAATLGEIGERAKEAAPDLGRALAENGQSPEVIKAASAALARLGDSGTSALVAALKDKRPVVRRFAAGAIGDVRSAPPSAVGALTEALADDDNGVRAAAAESLGNIGRRAKSALAALEARAARDPNEDVRRAAAKAIASINRE